jgi:hypothetical protein
MRKLILLILISYNTQSCTTNSLNDDKQNIISLLKAQEKAWSTQDFEAFMEGYWKSDSLKFYGADGLKYGWQTTLDSYKKRYPTKDDTGTLKFKINDISQINSESYFVMGEYHLKRNNGNANGIFMIILKKINGAWKIIADSSC